MNYNYNYGYNDSFGLEGVAGILGGLFLIIMLFALAVCIYSIVVLWKVFQKAGKPGWAAIVPIYNLWVLTEITWGNGIWFLCYFASMIPVVGAIVVMVFGIITYIKLAKAFGKSGGFGVGLYFLNPIFMSILAFGKSEYIGVPDNGNLNFNNNNMNNNNMNNYQNNQFNNMNYNNMNNYQNEQMNNNINNTTGQMNMSENNYNNSQQNSEFTNNNQQDNMAINNDNVQNVNTNTATAYCPNCGSQINNDAAFCVNCGNKLK